jgi:hypothetical protein
LQAQDAAVRVITEASQLQPGLLLSLEGRISLVYFNIKLYVLPSEEAGVIVFKINTNFSPNQFTF